MSGIDLRAALAIPGWMTKTELAWLAAQAQISTRIIECGSYQGRSTRALADHCPGVVYAIDPWDGPCLREDGSVAPNDWQVRAEFDAHLRDHLDTGRVVAIPGRFTDIAPELRLAGVQADLVFIDGDHRRASCAADIDAARPLVKPGGILSGHDYQNASWPGVTAAVEAAFPTGVQTVGLIWWVRP